MRQTSSFTNMSRLTRPRSTSTQPFMPSGAAGIGSSVKYHLLFKLVQADRAGKPGMMAHKVPGCYCAPQRSHPAMHHESRMKQKLPARSRGSYGRARAGAPAANATARATSLREAAYEAIKHRIITCVFRPGEYINELQLSTLLKIGRTPVHQALD